MLRIVVVFLILSALATATAWLLYAETFTIRSILLYILACLVGTIGLAMIANTSRKP